jgi:hypothetical protein
VNRKPTLKDLTQKATILDENFDLVKNSKILVSIMNNTKHTINKAMPKELEKQVKSSQVNTLPKAKSQSKDKRAKDRQ